MNYIFLLAGHALNNLTALAVAPLIIKELSLTAWGEFSLFLVASALFSAIYVGKNQSIHSDLIKIIWKRRNKDRVIAIHAGLVFNRIIGRRLYLVTFILLSLIFHETGSFYTMAAIIVGCVNGYLQSVNALARLKHLVFSDYEGYFKYAITIFFGKIIVIYILIISNIDIFYLMIGYTCCNFIEIYTRAANLRCPINQKEISLIQQRSHRLTIPMFFFAGSALVDRFIIEFLFTKEEFGLYNLMMMIIGAIVFAISPLNQFLLNSKTSKMDESRYFILCLIMFLIVAFIGYSLITYTSFLSHSDFSTLLKYHIFYTVIFTAFFQVLTGLTMVKHQKEQNIRFYRFLGIIAAVLNFLFIPSLAHLYEFEGALIGFLIVNFLTFIIAFRYR